MLTVVRPQPQNALLVLHTAGSALALVCIAAWGWPLQKGFYQVSLTEGLIPLPLLHTPVGRVAGPHSPLSEGKHRWSTSRRVDQEEGRPTVDVGVAAEVMVVGLVV